MHAQVRGHILSCALEHARGSGMRAECMLKCATQNMTAPLGAPVARMRSSAASKNALPMTASLIDGNQIAQQLRAEIKARVDARRQKGLRAPGLAVIKVGNDPASEVYVRNKR